MDGPPIRHTLRCRIRYTLDPPSLVHSFEVVVKKNGSCLEAGPFLRSITRNLQMASGSIPKPLEHLPGRPCPGYRVGSLGANNDPKTLTMQHTHITVPCSIIVCPHRGTLVPHMQGGWHLWPGLPHRWHRKVWGS